MSIPKSKVCIYFEAHAMDMDVITPIWFVSCDSRYTSISICHEMSQSFQRHENIFTFTDQRRRRHLQKEIFCYCCVLKILIMGISLVWAIAVNPTLSVKFYNSIFSDSPQSSAGEILQSIKWFIASMYTPRCKQWVFKIDFRKLCQHPFNLSSCETSSISHNPLSSYYCYWISSCRFCKMKLYFWCQASSNLYVVKLTIFYKEPFIQSRIHL